jgi:hypothetical protein
LAGHNLRRVCLLKHTNEGKINGCKWRGEKEEDVSTYWITLRKWGYWKLEEEALHRSVRRTRFGEVYCKTDYRIHKHVKIIKNADYNIG